MRIEKEVVFIRPSLNLSKPDAVEPLAQVHLATILGQTGKYRITILDEAFQPTTEDLLSGAEVVCIGADTAQYSRAKKILTMIREMDKKTRQQRMVHLGGSHATALKGKLLNDGWDSVFVGEADTQIADIVGLNYQGLVLGKNLRTDEWKSLPIPDRDLLFHQYGKNEDERAASIFTSRGCPYTCIYCFKGVRGRQITYRPLEHLFLEIQDIINRGFKKLYIYDDTLTIMPERVIQIAKFINNRLQWSCNSRTELNQTMLKEMRAGGCDTISMGVETASEEGLKFIGKGISKDEAVTAVKMVKDAGIKARVYMMWGLPFDSNQTVDSSLDLIEEMNPDGVQLALAIPLPGSELYNRAGELGISLESNLDLYYYIGPHGPHTFINRTNYLDEKGFAIALDRLQQGILEWSKREKGRFVNIQEG